MQNLLSDIRTYLKQNYKRRETLYSSCANQFPTHRKKPIFSTQKLTQTSPALVKTPLEVKKSYAKPIEQKKAVLEPPAKKETSEKPLPETPEKQLTPSPFAIQKQDIKARSQAPSMKLFYQKYAPYLQVHEQPKPDDLAKKVKSKSEDQKTLSKIVIFSDPKLKSFQSLLSNLSHAIDVKFGSCKLLNIEAIEKTNRWENILTSNEVQLILIPEIILKNYPRLKNHYSERESRHRLGKIDCFLLSHLKEIQESPEKKKLLWKAITEKVASK